MLIVQQVKDVRREYMYACEGQCDSCDTVNWCSSGKDVCDRMKGRRIELRMVVYRDANGQRNVFCRYGKEQKSKDVSPVILEMIGPVFCNTTRPFLLVQVTTRPSLG